MRLQPSVRDTWKDVAEEYGGIFHEHPEAIEVEIGEAAVYVDTCKETRRSNNTSYHEYLTRFQAPYLVPAGPTFRIRGKNRILGIVVDGKAGVELGHKTFDSLFRIGTNDIGKTRQIRQMWSDNAIDILLNDLPQCIIRSTGDEISFKIQDIVDDPHILDAGIELLAELANTDIFGIWSLEKIPDARYIRPSGPWNDRTLPYAEINSHILITIGPVDNAILDPVTRVESEEVGYKKNLTMKIEDNSFDISETEFPLSIRSILAHVGDGILRTRQDIVTFQWHSIETDPQKLQAGVELIGAFARLHQGLGAYR